MFLQPQKITRHQITTPYLYKTSIILNETLFPEELKFIHELNDFLSIDNIGLIKSNAVKIIIKL